MFAPWTKIQWIALCLGIAILLFIPQLTDNDGIRTWMDVLMFMILAMSWNFIGGLTGYPSFASAAFFGLGAYTTAILMNHGVHFVVAMPLGGVVGGSVALLLGLPILRLRGHYFAIATYGVAEGLRELVENLEITGAADGINLPQIQGTVDYFTQYFYYSMLAVAVLTFMTTYWVTRSRLGYGLVAIRENEDAAGMLGVEATKYKIAAFVLSGIFPAMAGGVYAYRAAFVEPIDVFDVLFSIQAIVMALLGGIGTVMGPLVGAAFLEYIKHLVWSQFIEFHSAFLGLIMVLVVIFTPRGVMAVAQEMRTRRGLRSLGSILLANTQRYRV
jgi:branched-chain amino acid transport system permease protein